MEASPLAKIFFIGIWSECDDGGSFEWSPLRLKARLLPADNCDPSELLAELCRLGMVMSYELDCRQYGAVRNFCRFQRPKKPKRFCPQTEEVENWCGTRPLSEDESSPLVGNQFGTGRGIPPQKEGKKEGRKGGRELSSLPGGSQPSTTRGAGFDDDEPFGAVA